MAMKKEKKGQEGTSLLEVILAMLLLLVLMISILQMFSMVFAINVASEARTEMTFKAQQVAENLRYINYMLKEHRTPDGVTVPANTNPEALNTGLSFVSVGTLKRFAVTSYGGVNLLSSDGTLSSLDTSFWGPNGSNVFDISNPKMSVNIIIEDPATTTLPAPTNPDAIPLRATITVRSNNVHGPRFLASGDRKVVQYVTELTKQ